MRLDLAYRLFSHGALALASACLVQAEEPFLPGLPTWLIPYLAFVALAFVTEGRWVLPAWGANLLGLLIAGGGVWWMLDQVEQAEGWARDVGLTGALVPSLGPVVMALTLVKLFRPHQGAADFWSLQGMGLIQVGLGCVLATEPVFGFLLAAYLAAALGCLALHQQLDGRPAVAGGTVRLPLGWLFRFIAAWLLTAGAAALVLFLLTPRGEVRDWDALRQFGTPGRPAAVPAQTGFEVGMNLNRVGSVEVDDEVALSVTATTAGGQPKADLPADQLWRGVVLDRYEKGVWTTWLVLPHGHQDFDQHRLPWLGPGQWFLDFKVEPKRAGGLFLAEPVWPGTPRFPLPVMRQGPRAPMDPPLFMRMWGTVVPMPQGGRELCQYRQALPAGKNPGRQSARGLEPWYLQRLLVQDLPALPQWTHDLLRRLAREPRYRLQGLPLPSPREAAPEEAHWEAIARALADYLAHSGEYGYTLDLFRNDSALDPVLDFLWNVKQGHCERFAAALTVMLRSQGIPARVVKGFRGADSQGEGKYTVRQSHAHAWVEVLVLHPGGPPGRYDWLTLNPTPDSGPLPERGHGFALLRWWHALQRRARVWWRELILGYNTSLQEDLLAYLGAGPGLRAAVAGARLGLLVLLALGGLVWAVRRLRQRLRRAVPAGESLFPWYARLLRLLARHGLEPGPSQTPREFGAAARRALAALPAAAPLADLPETVADLYYRARFGGRAPAEDEGRTLDARLDLLEAALRGVPGDRVRLLPSG